MFESSGIKVFNLAGNNYQDSLKFNHKIMYKILSLDGGGSWAILQLLTLKDRYGDVHGHEILRDFDLVIANSGGSIVLAALAENWKISESLDLFQKKDIRESIFQRNTFKERFFPVDYLGLFKIGIGPKYSTSKKISAFRNLFKEVNKRQMSELPGFIGKDSLKLVVATYDALNNRAKFFRSYGAGETEYDSVKLTQAIHGSSNAPVQYFDFPARFKTRKTKIYYELWDGALGGFNNPVLAGFIEALKNGITIREMRIVSIGTGNKLMSLKSKKIYWDLKQQTILRRKNKIPFRYWRPQAKYFQETILNQAKTILYQPPDWANYVTMFFLTTFSKEDDHDHLIRLSPLIHSDENTPAEVRDLLDNLYDLDMDLTTDQDLRKLTDCFKEWKNNKILNQPLEFKVERNNNLIFMKGDQYYGSAMKRWKSWV